MAFIEAECAYVAKSEWKRCPDSVMVNVAKHLCESVEVIIINEGYPCDEYQYSKEEDEIIIREERSISGKLRANEDGSVSVAATPGDPNDDSYKFVQYELSTHGSREEPQPRCILLESQLESLKHHFVHWNLSGPTPIVQCQELQKYDRDGPIIDLNNAFDQKFVWVIPLEDSNQFSLKTYNRSYYFAFESDGKSTLCKDAMSDQQNYNIFRFQKL